jgi:MFS family permease
MQPSIVPSPSAVAARAFFGPWVVRGAFVLAMFGWGLGFYGLPVYLQAVIERTGWPIAWVSGAVTVHYLFGAWVITRLPRLHARFGVGPVAVVGACVSTLGLVGWALCTQLWQLMVAALASGGGWGTMGAFAVNAAIAPWFGRTRPRALVQAYNGASVGGVVFAPLWVAAIGWVGFVAAAIVIGLTAVAVMAVLAATVLAATPRSLGQQPDGDAPTPPPPASTGAAAARPARLWRERCFQTLAAGMALGLFAQIGLFAHLFALIVPVLGRQHAGWTMGMAVACAIGGRYLAVWALARVGNRRTVAAGAYGVQLLGTLLLMVSPAGAIAPLLIGVALFGANMGNATSLPPLIAQNEFAAADVSRAVALIVALAQATYAFGPLAFGALLASGGVTQATVGHGTVPLLAAVAAVQVAAIGCFLAGRTRVQTSRA